MLTAGSASTLPGVGPREKVSSWLRDSDGLDRCSHGEGAWPRASVGRVHVLRSVQYQQEGRMLPPPLPQRDPSARETPLSMIKSSWSNLLGPEELHLREDSRLVP